MKPNTKKTIIIIVAIAIIAAIVYFVVRNRNGKKALSLVDMLSITSEQKAAMKAKVNEILANANDWSGWSRSEIERKAKEKGYTYAQWLVVEAAYALYYESNWTLFNTIGTEVKNL